MKNLAEDAADFVSAFARRIETNWLERKEETSDRYFALKEKERVKAKELDGYLKEIESKTDGRLKEIEIEKHYHLSKLQEKYDKKLNIYRDYLVSLDSLKIKLEKAFPDTPQPLLLIIYHHSTNVLHDMWDASNKQEMIKAEKQFAELMVTIGKDIRYVGKEEQVFLPDRTLEYINSNK